MLVENDHAVLIIQGLGDNHKWVCQAIKTLTGGWTGFGLSPIVYMVGWQDGEINFQPKLDRLVRRIDGLKTHYKKVSLVGLSAGGSAAFNAFLERNGVVYKAVNVCGRLFPGDGYNMRSLNHVAQKSPLFKESVLLFSQRVHELTNDDRIRLMTVRGKFWDELVPAKTSVLEGATNITVPMFEHIINIGLALGPMAKPVIEFLAS
jgi:hypothetical protein